MKPPPHKFGPGYDNIRTQRPSKPDHSIRDLLLKTSKKLDDAVKDGYVPEYTEVDDRPLIDKLHQATFTDNIGLQYIEDKYALRMLLRKAQRFTLDDDTSRMTADFSLAIAHDLDTVRQLSIPPFPVTWIDINNVARLNRIKELGGRLTASAAGELAGAPVDRVGWLIWPSNDMGTDDGHYMIYAAEVDQGILVSPLAWWWHTGVGTKPILMDVEGEFIERLTFGMKGTNVGQDAFVMPSLIHRDYNREKLFNHKGRYSKQIREMMLELSGELRFVFGFLIAMASTRSSLSPQEKSAAAMRYAPNGKPLLPLEHKVMHLHLRPRVAIKDLVLRAVTKHKMREHDVRAHLRTLRNADGSVRKIVKVHDHKRGDAALGRIVRDETVVEK